MIVEKQKNLSLQKKEKYIVNVRSANLKQMQNDKLS